MSAEIKNTAAGPSASSSADGSKGLSKIVNDLGKRFQSRATPQELVQKNIMREDEINGMSSSLVQQKKDLEAEKAKNALERKINLRPSKEALAQKNILKDSIQEEEAAETFEQRQMQLKSCLKKRAPKADLENQNILKAGEASSAIVVAQEQLKRSMLEDTLENKIANRPPVEELQEKKIIFFAETVEVLPTFRKSEYNRKPDATATFKNLTQQMKVDIREELNNFKKEEMDIHPDSSDNTCFH